MLTAAFFGRTEVVEILLEAGADRTIRHNAGSTPLDVVTAPLEAVRPVYEAVGRSLGPLGLELDYPRLKADLPRIAGLLKRQR